jgi:hypothetical protein
MRYLKTFEQATEKYSVFDTSLWQSLLPESLNVVTENGRWTLSRENRSSSIGHAVDISNLMNSVQISYHQNTVDLAGGDVTADGEPDYLSIDINIVKENKGSSANPDTLKLDVDICYGDSMKYEFTISKPGLVEVHNYNGYNSLLDPSTSFGFVEESLLGLIRFFESWGFRLRREDFNFIDESLSR